MENPSHHFWTILTELDALNMVDFCEIGVLSKYVQHILLYGWASCIHQAFPEIIVPFPGAMPTERLWDACGRILHNISESISTVSS